MSAIKFDTFSYAYKHPVKVLDSIDFTVNSGSFSVLLGPSGAGKTTVCLALAGAVPHYFGGSLSGTVTVNGVQTTQTTMPELARTVGSVLQDYEIQLVTMTVEEEIAFSLENLTDSVDIGCRTAEVLAEVGLTGYETAEISSLSGGQKQRLAIASALAANPRLLVLDEPSSALDPDGTASLYRLLSRLNRDSGLTIIVVEHDIAQVLPYADQFILLNQGRIAAAGTPEEVLTEMAKQHFIQALPPLWQLKLALEASTEYRFSAWKDEQSAIKELQSYLEKEADSHA